ncbi:merozoite surface protein 7 (MSP7) [Plasmodium vivax India VII]|uniref:Merozoite surface protein 7 (MSP7) n=1 Tax=Plasmodium vivax India VII TaxID=1077284 RepID=A0A0J9V0H3_PLAVI|nr:merozoite surface protein 7 (MSP7) [Plasmodium vivax India VII]
MRGKYVMMSSFLFFLSLHTVPCEKLGIQKKKKNLEQDAMHALMKKLESLYKLSATDNGEIFNKEIDALKKQIDQLQQHGGDNEGESLGHLLENEAADDSGKKTIFGVDEDDLDNYDADFIGQGKKIITKGAVDSNEEDGGDEDEEAVEGDEAEAGEEGEEEATNEVASHQSGSGDLTPSPPASGELAPATARGETATDSPTSQEPSQTHTTGSSRNEGQSSTSSINPPPAPAAALPQPASPVVSAPEGEPESGRVPNVKYLDKLYDEVLKTTDAKNGIHVPPFHSKYNDFRKGYEFTMNERECQIVKNLFDACFNKDGNPSPADAVSFFKKMLNDPNVQKEFDNFVHGLYGFAKRHNYLRGERMTDTKLYDELLKNVVNLLNTIEVK